MSGDPSNGQNLPGPLVSYPQTGHRHTSRRPKNGKSGTKRNRKKNGKPRAQRTAVTTRDPARRMPLRIQRFVGPPP